MICFCRKYSRQPLAKLFRGLLQLPVSFPRKRESRLICLKTWMPACAGMTISACRRVASLNDFLARPRFLTELVGVVLAFVALGFAQRSSHAADAKPAWQTRVGKNSGRGEEGRPSRDLYQRLRGDVCRIFKRSIRKSRSSPSRAVDPGRPALIAERRADKVLGGCRQLRRRNHLSTIIHSEGIRSDQAGAYFCPRSPIYRNGIRVDTTTTIPRDQYVFQLRRFGDLRFGELQYQAGRCEGVQILLGSTQPQVEGENHLARYSCARAPVRAMHGCFIIFRMSGHRSFANCTATWM